MATFKFRLRPLPNTTGQTDIMIYCFYTHNQKQFPFPTGEKVKPDNWDAEKQKVRAGQKGCTEINKRLQHYHTLANEALTKATLQGIEPTIAYIKNVLQGNPEPETTPAPELGFFDLWQVFIDRQTESLTKQHTTIKAYKTVRNKVMELSKASGLTLNLNTIDKNTGEQIEAAYRKANYASGTINNHIKFLKVFVRWAIESGYATSNEGLKIKKPKAERTTIQFLDMQEVNQIEKAVLPAHLNRHRDLFLFTCYTGLRYSDLANLKPENYKGNQLELTTIKTHDTIRIPLTPPAKAILEKYEGKLPNPITNQKMNEALKEIGKLSGLTKTEQIVSIKGGKRIQENIPKWELISCHVGRRTFIVYSLQKGVRPETLMKVTGHHDIRTLMQYVKITDEVISNELLAAWQ